MIHVSQFDVRIVVLDVFMARRPFIHGDPLEQLSLWEIMEAIIHELKHVRNYRGWMESERSKLGPNCVYKSIWECERARWDQKVNSEISFGDFMAIEFQHLPEERWPDVHKPRPRRRKSR